MVDGVTMRERVSEKAKMAREQAGKAKDKIMEQRQKIDSASSVAERISPRVYFGLSLGSILLSLGLFIGRRKEDAVFIGHWAPTFLALGLFAKLIAPSQAPPEENVIMEPGESSPNI